VRVNLTLIDTISGFSEETLLERNQFILALAKFVSPQQTPCDAANDRRYPVSQASCGWI
jgi:hypothetical protein